MIRNLLQEIYRQKGTEKTLETISIIAILKKLRENHENLLVGSRCNNNNNKLELEHNFGIMGNLLVWLRDYLSVREQYTVINGVPSKNTNVAHGILQGSILGPILFA